MARSYRFFLALFASGISVVAWIGTGAGVLATMFFAVTGGPVGEAGVATIVALLVAAVFAIIEKRLYALEPEE